MTGVIYTSQRSKLTKKQRAVREALLQEQREIKKQLKAIPVVVKPCYVNPVVRRETPRIPSLDTGVGIASKKEAPVYTGTSMIGIGQMHKSNAVPIFKSEDAKDLAKMRR